MSDIIAGSETPPEWRAEKEDLDKAVSELIRVSQGTSVQLTLPLDMLTIQLDELVDSLCLKDLVDRKQFLINVKVRVERLTSDVRRAILTTNAPFRRGD